MGGPKILTRFGRQDAGTSWYSVEEQEGRLPSGTGDAKHLREIFYPKGFNDRDIVALSGAHTVGSCHLDRSGFVGSWTENDRVFDNSFFKNLLEKEYKPMETEKGKPQTWHDKSQTMMLLSDIALIQDKEFRKHVEEFAKD